MSIVRAPLSFIFLFAMMNAGAQLRQIHTEPLESSTINSISFFSPSSGYASFTNWLGYTTDSGHTFVRKDITFGNVDFNGYNVNLTFGFGIKAIKTFDANNIVLAGDYGFVPAILTSADGGDTFKLVFHSQFDLNSLTGGITDLVFPQGTTIGYAVDADRILKTTNRGASWTPVRTSSGSYWDWLQAVDDNNVYAFSAQYNTAKLFKTTNAGASWTNVTLPGTQLNYATFLTAQQGWVNMDNNLYLTVNAGASWTLLNDPDATPFFCKKMKFTDANTGYAIGGLFTSYKTLDGGRTWEALPRNNSYEYLGFGHEELSFYSPTQLWTGGTHGFLEISTNGGGTPVPKAFFKIDTASLSVTNTVNLINFSRMGYTHRWLLNGTPLSTNANASFTHDIHRLADTVTLIITSGGISDTLTRYQYYHEASFINSFSPVTGASGTLVTIKGTNLLNVTSVLFGGIPAASFNKVSDTLITATVGAGATGSVTILNPYYTQSLAGFTYLPPPTITSFTPASGIAGTSVTITGTNFNNASSVSFAGVAATFVVLSPTTITAIVPSGGSGVIKVTTPGGTVSSNGWTAVPKINSFTPLSGTNGTVMTINGTSLGEVTAITIGGVAVKSFMINSMAQITAIVGANSNGNAIVTSPGGSSTLGTFTYFAASGITSFSPLSGPVGTTVTINGNNFSTNAAANIVWFGAVKATVVTATTNALTVLVPFGATFRPVTVTTNGLTSYSDKPFLVTFPGGGSITETTFAPPVMVPLGTPPSAPYSISLSDIDADGKADICAPLAGNFKVQLVRNISTVGNPAFNGTTNLAAGDDPTGLYMADLDGDGKMDAVTVETVDDTLYTYLNTGSGPGQVSFIPGPHFSTSGNGVTVGDLDGDGKPDVLTSSGDCYRNISERGNLVFAGKTHVFSGSGWRVQIVDLDGDSKRDVLLSDISNGQISIWRNTSTIGNISFVSGASLPVAYDYDVVAADMDGDGKQDVLGIDPDHTGISLFQNKSTPGNFSFGTPVTYPSMASPVNLAVTDLDGDGKLDVAVVSSYDSTLSLYKNTSSSGSISLSNAINYNSGKYPHGFDIGDVDGDGRPDLVLSSEGRSQALVFRNQVSPQPFIESFTPTIGKTGTVVAIKGTNFSTVTGVSFGGQAPASFTINSSTSITATIGAGASGDVVITNGYGAAKKAGFVFGIPPVITSVNPEQGPVDTTVIITGVGFSAVPSENIVRFGAVMGQVLSSTVTSVVVKVPVAADYKRITVTVNKLTAESVRPFIITYPGAPATLTKSSFGSRKDFTNYVGSGGIADLDNDGKPDIIGSGTNNALSVERNTGSPGVLSFATKQSFPSSTASFRPIAADMDGDGNPEVITMKPNGIFILKNNSTVGAIQLDSAQYADLGYDPESLELAAADFDHDGKLDIAVANYTHRLCVFRNTTSNGVISFARRVDYPANGYPTGITTGDFDGDGIIDVAVTVNSSGVYVFRGKSVPGTIQFDNPLLYPMNDWPTGVQAVDLDKDGKPDLIGSSINGGALSIFRNISTPGNIAFASKIDIATSAGPSYLAIGDLDGDGRPDIAVPGRYTQNVSVFKNNSVPGTISIAPALDMPLLSSGYTTEIADMDMDGQQDLLVYCSDGTISIFRNQSTGVVEIDLCPNSDTTLPANLSGTDYQWQQDNGTGYTNITDGPNFAGSSTKSLAIKSTPPTWENYKFRCLVDGNPGSVYYLHFLPPAVTPFVRLYVSDSTVCLGTNVTFTAASSNTGSLPGYQWTVNGVNAGTFGTNNYTFSSSTLPDLAQVQVTVKATTTCSPTASSNIITMQVNQTGNPSVTLSASSQAICNSNPVVFTANPVDGGDSPNFNWFLNGNEIIGAITSTYSTSNLKGGDEVWVTMRSNLPCLLSPFGVTSNHIILTAGSGATATVSVAGSHEVQGGVTPLLTAIPTGAASGYTLQWQDSTSAHSWQDLPSAINTNLLYTPFSTSDAVRCVLTDINNCTGALPILSAAFGFTIAQGSTGGPVHAYPNPVHTELTIDSLRLSDNWQTLEVLSMNGNPTNIIRNIQGQTKVTIRVDALPAGMYVALLRRKDGEPVYVVFVKQ